MSLQEQLPGLYDDAALSDVTFIVGPRRLEIHAHRVLLSLVSSRAADSRGSGGPIGLLRTPSRTPWILSS